jgi:hypothetical protein
LFFVEQTNTQTLPQTSARTAATGWLLQGQEASQVQSEHGQLLCELVAVVDFHGSLNIRRELAEFFA